MKLDWKQLKRPILALSPMADMTDSAFCRLVRLITIGGSCHGVCAPSVVSSLRCGPPAGDPTPCHPPTTIQSPILFREMISSEAVVRGNKKTLAMSDIHPDERPIVQQLFGSNPEVMAKAARMIEEEHHPDGFDINMGCPVYKIVHNFNGAALMNEPDRAQEIVRKMKATVSVPVSVKIRTGWSDPTQCLEFAKVLENAGADMITIHGRTKTQGYSGKSDWDRIREVKQLVSIPVLANGDIHSAELTLKALEQTGCDGVSIARGALGNPWIFCQIHEMLNGKPPTIKQTMSSRLPTTALATVGASTNESRDTSTISWNERIDVMKNHFVLHIEQYGVRGVPTFRKHVSWYLRGITGAKKYKEKLQVATTVEEVDNILDGMKDKL